MFGIRMVSPVGERQQCKPQCARLPLMPCGLMLPAQDVYGKGKMGITGNNSAAAGPGPGAAAGGATAGAGAGAGAQAGTYSGAGSAKQDL